MQKSRQEIKDNKIIGEILGSSEICRLAFMDGNRPYILPFNYGYRDNCIFIHCAREGRKIELLKENNQVCFEVEQHAEIIHSDKACRWTTRYRSVVGYGYVDIVDDFEEKCRGLDVIMKHNGARHKPDYEKKNVDNMLLLRLNITEISGKQSDSRNGA